MSREIKFRAWDIKNKRFVNIVRLIFDQFGALDYADVVYKGKLYKLYPSEIILEQYTGLKDKNGKEICEGDIITETIDDGSNKIIQMYEVYWDIDTLCWSIKGVKGFDYNLHDDLWQTNSSREVIGNIHENPELLEGEK